MMTFRVILIITILVAGYPVIQLQLNDFSIYENVTEKIGELEELDAKADALALRSRVGIDQNYDELAKIPGLINALKDGDLQSMLSNQHLKNISIDKFFSAYQEAATNKESVIENFKTHNSVLRNSVRYAPEVGNRLTKLALDNNLDKDAVVFEKLSKALLLYGLLGDEEVAGDIRTHLQYVQEREPKLPESMIIQTLELINHTKVILEEKPLTDQYLRKAVTARTSKLLDDLQTAVTSHQETQVKKSAESRYVLYGYILLLACVLGYVVFEIYSSRGTYVKKIKRREAEIIKLRKYILSHSKRKPKTAEAPRVAAQK